MEPDDLAEAWELFRNEGDLAARNDLIVHYSPLVQMIAGKVHAGLPALVDRNDLVSYGTFGLIEVLSSYDPERGVQFATFATPRIRGSIIDELRKIDPVSRTIRSKARDVERVKTELQVELNREPTNAEVAGQLGCSVQDLWDLQSEVHRALLASLDDEPAQSSIPDHESQGPKGDALYDRGANPEEVYTNTVEIRELVATAIEHLDERYKQILVLYYIEDLTLSEIGDILGVTESRVCQLQGKVLTALREALGQGALAAA